MHIQPIGAGREACFRHSYLDPCGNGGVARESPEARAFVEMLRTGLLLRPAVSSIPTLFLRLATAGFFPRQKYDVNWQALHGNWLHYGGSHRYEKDTGQHLDIVI